MQKRIISRIRRIPPLALMFAALVGLGGMARSASAEHPAVKKLRPLAKKTVSALVQEVDWVELVIAAADAVTTRTSEKRHVDVASKSRGAEVVVARARVVASYESIDSNWRGKVRLKMIVPADVYYAVDLNRLRPEDVEWDPTRKLLKIAMPALEVYEVVPIVEQREMDTLRTLGRPSWLESDADPQILDICLDHVRADARAKGKAEIDSCVESGRHMLGKILEKFLRLYDPEVEVIVD